MPRKNISHHPNKAAFREALGLTGAGGKDKSEKIRKRLRDMLDDHFDWHQSMACQNKQALDAVEADVGAPGFHYRGCAILISACLQMQRYLPQEMLTPRRIKVLWGYMKKFYYNQRWILKSKGKIGQMNASTARDRSIDVDVSRLTSLL